MIGITSESIFQYTELRKAASKRQIINNGFDRFVRYFKPIEPMALIIGTDRCLYEKGFRGIYMQQSKRRRFLRG
jgi:hypothetical protein